MAMRVIFRCTGCGFELEAWDEGNPYIEGPDGKRHHFYHLSQESEIISIVQTILGRPPTETATRDALEKHAGNEQDHICLNCADRSLRNEQEANAPCAACAAYGHATVVDCFQLAWKPCLSCRQGAFAEGQPGGIS